MHSVLAQVIAILPLEPITSCDGLFSWRAEPAAECAHYVREVGDRLVGWTVRGNEAVQAQAIAFLAGVTPALLDTVSDASPYALVSAAPAPFGRFGHVCVVHPTWAEYCFNTPTRFMTTAVYQVLPCFRSEVTADESREEFRFRVGGRGSVNLNDPCREPHPALRMRFEHLRPKRGGSKKGGIYAWPEVAAEVHKLPWSGGYVELENFERSAVRLTHDGDGWLLSAASKRRELPQRLEALEPWLSRFCFEGQSAAERGGERPAASLGVLERAVRDAGAALAQAADGELPGDALEALCAAVLATSAGACVAAANRTAASACVEPQLPVSLAAEARRLLAALNWDGEGLPEAPEAPAAQRAAARCLVASRRFARRRDPAAWCAMARALREARLPAHASAEAVARVWRDWLRRIVATADSGRPAALAHGDLVEAIATAREVPQADWTYEGSVDDDGVYRVAIMDRASRRMGPDVLSGRMELAGRLLRWTVGSADGLPLGRARTEELVERALLAEFTYGYYDERIDAIEVSDPIAGLSYQRSWS